MIYKLNTFDTGAATNFQESTSLFSGHVYQKVMTWDILTLDDERRRIVWKILRHGKYFVLRSKVLSFKSTFYTDYFWTKLKYFVYLLVPPTWLFTYVFKSRCATFFLLCFVFCFLLCSFKDYPEAPNFIIDGASNFILPWNTTNFYAATEDLSMIARPSTLLLYKLIYIYLLTSNRWSRCQVSFNFIILTNYVYVLMQCDWGKNW